MMHRADWEGDLIQSNFSFGFVFERTHKAIEKEQRLNSS